VSADAAQDRQREELRQGAELAAIDADDVWGWDGAAGRRRADRRAAMIVEWCELAPGKRCLELGSGTGVFTERLADTGCELVAIELSPETAAVCRARLDGRAEVIVGDIETGAGIEGSFDAIVGVSVLHHVQLERTLRVMRARLRAGGRFAFSEPNVLNPQVWAERRWTWAGRHNHVLPHETAFTAGELRHSFEDAGFRVATARPFDFLHPGTPSWAVNSIDAVGGVLERTPARLIAGSVFVAGAGP
jgi:SAM-dependent methyltransferase